MPVTKLVCPHCEKTVEIQASAVTRSRPCPECGQMVMLQMAEKSTKTKRRALLMGQAEPAAAASAEEPERTPTKSGMSRLEPSHEPQVLAGDAFERMRMDPEIHQFRRRLVIGGGTVAAIVIVLMILNLIRPVEVVSEKSSFSAALDRAGTSEAPVVKDGVSERPVAPMIAPEELLPPVSSGNLVFRPPGSQDLKTAKASTKAEAGANLARLAAAEEVIGKFLRAENWKQRAPLVRQATRVEPLMSIFYSKNADGPMAFDSLVEAKEISPMFSEHVVVFEGGGRRQATVEHTAEGPKVDWESFVGAGEMAWSDFLESKPGTPRLFRVLVSPAGHFENQFGDPSLLQCYSLRCVSEPGAKVVYGYVNKSSSLAREIDYWLQQSSDATVPMTLRLKFPLDATADFQVWVHQLVQSGWMIK